MAAQHKANLLSAPELLGATLHKWGHLNLQGSLSAGGGPRKHLTLSRTWWVWVLMPAVKYSGLNLCLYLFSLKMSLKGMKALSL